MDMIAIKPKEGSVATAAFDNYDLLSDERLRKLQEAYDSHSCKHRSNSERSPFLVFILFKASGRFLGMGSIIDKRTVITAEVVVKKRFSTANDIIVLGGSLSPWWGDNSQVRKVDLIKYSPYEIALLRLATDWDFNKKVSPIRLTDEGTKHKVIKDFSKTVGLFGITSTEYRMWGSAVPKSKTYFFGVHSVASHDRAECRKLYASDLKVVFNKLTHYCVFHNKTYCHGNLGGPAVELDNNGKALITGVVIRTTCLELDLVVRIPYVQKWIRKNSLLHIFPH